MCLECSNGSPTYEDLAALVEFLAERCEKLEEELDAIRSETGEDTGSHPLPAP